MEVILADRMGMCFGVKDAIVRAREAEEPRSVTILGQLVHNGRVSHEMARRGFRRTPETGAHAVPETPRVLITAHGASDRERQRLAASGKEIIDTTCPLVWRAHRAAIELQEDGHFVVVIGRAGHVEVRGLVGDLDAYDVVEDAGDVKGYGTSRIGIISQTTTPPWLFDELCDAIRRRNPGKQIRVVNTICRPTRERQDAVLALLDQVEALIVVGGENSNNTRQLGALAETRGVPWCRVDSPADLDPGWLELFGTVGLTAGTSTPDSVIRAVHSELLAMASGPDPQVVPTGSLGGQAVVC